MMSCELCNKKVHSECARYIFEYNHLRNLWQCLECTKTEKKRYNPFSAINIKKYDPVQITESEDIAEISNVLESCKSYNPEKVKNLLQENSNFETLPSILFNNFDHFVCDISQYSHPFSFIGISGYTSEYTSEYNVKKL